MSNFEIFKKEILSKNASVLYEPFNGEVDYKNESFPFIIHKNKILLPNDKESNPIYWADKCKKEFKNLNPYILIPGTKFDLYGTRHGRGGGWYDRFLSELNKDWLRVGVAYKSQISKDKLTREEWDQPVDWVVVKNSLSWEVHKVEY